MSARQRVGAVDRLVKQLRNRTELVHYGPGDARERPDEDCQAAADWLEALSGAGRRALTWIGSDGLYEAHWLEIGEPSPLVEALRAKEGLHEALTGLQIIKSWFPVVGTRWRHNVRGSVYVELGRAEVAAARAIVEGDKVVVYVGSFGKIWCEPQRMFLDRRYLRAEVQSAQPFETGTVVVVYLAEDGLVWCRPASEFEDGRFTKEEATR